MQVVGGFVEPDHPARGLQAERRRLGLLEQRAADDRRVAVRLGELRRGGGGAAQVVQERDERALGHEHRRGVHGVLARRVLVHRRVRLRLQRLDDGTRGVADLGRSRADRGHVVAVGVAQRGDLVGLLGRELTGLRLGAGERGLEVQQRLQPGAAGDLLGHATAREHAREDVLRV